MSELFYGALQEASDGLYYMGIDKHTIESDLVLAKYYRTAVGSIIEFGLDSFHPTTVDRKYDPAVGEIDVSRERCER